MAATDVPKRMPRFNHVAMSVPADLLDERGRAELLRFHAEGLGSVKREAPPAHWKVLAEWAAGSWSVTFDLAPWPLLDRSPGLAVAIWRGAADDRGGLKSVSPGCWARRNRSASTIVFSRAKLVSRSSLTST